MKNFNFLIDGKRYEAIYNHLRDDGRGIVDVIALDVYGKPYIAYLYKMDITLTSHYMENPTHQKALRFVLSSNLYDVLEEAYKLSIALKRENRRAWARLMLR